MKNLINAACLWLLLFAGQASAGNACATILCLGGSILGGNGGSMCKDPIQDYFDIKKYRKGKFSSSRTKTARNSFLNGCSEGTSADKTRIQSKYGSTFSNPF